MYITFKRNNRKINIEKLYFISIDVKNILQHTIARLIQSSESEFKFIFYIAQPVSFNVHIKSSYDTTCSTTIHV